MQQFLAIFLLLCSLTSFAQSKKPEILFKLQGHSDDLECLAVSGNGKLIASGSWDGMVNLFYTDSTYTPITSFSDHFSAVNSISITPNGKIIATGGADGKVFIYKIDSIGTISKEKVVNIHRMSVNAVVIDPSGKLLFTGSTDGTISFYDIYKNKDKKINNTNPVTSIAVSNDRRSIYCSDNTINIKKYDIMGTLIGTYEGHTDQVNSVVLTKDNKFLISGSSDKTIRIWNTQNGKLEKTLTGHDWKVLTVSVSLNGKYIVSGSNDGSMKLWDIELGKEIGAFDNIGTNVRGIAISNDNTKIFSSMQYPVDSFETKGILVLKSGIEIEKKVPPVLNLKAPLPKGAAPKGTIPKSSGVNPGTNKEVIKKTEEIEISEEKNKVPDAKREDNRQD